jgi:hypothetical protein
VERGSERYHESARTAEASPLVVVWSRRGVTAPAVSRVKEERWCGRAYLSCFSKVFGRRVRTYMIRGLGRPAFSHVRL